MAEGLSESKNTGLATLNSDQSTLWLVEQRRRFCTFELHTGEKSPPIESNTVHINGGIGFQPVNTLQPGETQNNFHKI